MKINWKTLSRTVSQISEEYSTYRTTTDLKYIRIVWALGPQQQLLCSTNTASGSHHLPMKTWPEKLPSGAEAGRANPQTWWVTRKACTDCATTRNASEFTESMLGSQDLPSTLHWAAEDFFLKVFFLFYFTQSISFIKKKKSIHLVLFLKKLSFFSLKALFSFGEAH